jgi:small-conductance mechanosensitive channel
MAAYGSDIDKVKEILLDIANNIEGAEKDHLPSVNLVALGDYALEFVVTIWVDNPSNQFAVKVKMNEEIYKRFNKENISIPYPTQNVYLRNSK